VLWADQGGPSSLSGVGGALLDEVELKAGRNLLLHGGSIRSADFIKLGAGENLLGAGENLRTDAGSFLDLQSAHDVEVSAGSGNLLLGDIGAERVTLKAGGGSIAQAASGRITADLLAVQALNEVALHIAGGTATVQVSGPGGISIVADGPVVLQHVSTADGAIQVAAEDTITALNVLSLTDAAGRVRRVAT